MSFRVRAHEASVTQVDQINRIVDNRIEGRARIVFNHLYLVQSPGLFLREVVPHELAHLVSMAGDVAQGDKPSYQHHDVFETWHRRLTTIRPKNHAQLWSEFDPRPAQLWNDGVPVICECSGTRGFHVYTKRKASGLKKEPTPCRHCKKPLMPTTDSAIPDDIRSQIRYLKGLADQYSKRQGG